MSTTRRLRGSHVASTQNLTVLASVVAATFMLAGCANTSPDTMAQCVDRQAKPQPVRVQDQLCPAGFGDSSPAQRYAWAYTQMPEGESYEDDDGNYGTTFAPIIIGDVGRPYSGGSYSKPQGFAPNRVALPPARVPVTPGMAPGTSTISRGGLGVTSGGTFGGSGGAKAGSSGS